MQISGQAYPAFAQIALMSELLPCRSPHVGAWPSRQVTRNGGFDVHAPHASECTGEQTFMPDSGSLKEFLIAQDARLRTGDGVTGKKSLGGGVIPTQARIQSLGSAVPTGAPHQGPVDSSGWGSSAPGRRGDRPKAGDSPEALPLQNPLL